MGSAPVCVACCGAGHDRLHLGFLSVSPGWLGFWPLPEDPARNEARGSGYAQCVDVHVGCRLQDECVSCQRKGACP